SIANQTALADAELEYQDVDDKSVYIEFELLTPSPGTPGEGGGEGSPSKSPHPNPPPEYRERGSEALLIWTTTPWTLPANLAVAVGQDVDYAKVKYTRDGKSRTVIVASDLVKAVMAR